MKFSGYYKGDCNITGHQQCHVPMFAHDTVHPSAVGHKIARDLLGEAIASTALATCRGQSFAEHKVSLYSGWMVGGRHYREILHRRSDYIFVKDTMQVFAKQDPLLSDVHTPGFELKADDLGRTGWIATNPAGGESVTFGIDLPVDGCYVIFLSALKSYENVGTFNVTVEDTLRNTTTTLRNVDCLWKKRISIPQDIRLTPDTEEATPGCSGKCNVIVTTNPKLLGRGTINQVKILSLSVRKCI